MGTVVHIQGNPNSPLTPLILIHAISGLALPCFALGDLSRNDFNEGQGRPVYGLSSPIFEESTSASRRRLNKRTLPSLAQEYSTLEDGHELRALESISYNAIAWRINGSKDLSMSLSLSPAGEEGSDKSSSESDQSRENSTYGSESDSDSDADEDKDEDPSVSGSMQQIREHVALSLRMLATYPTLPGRRCARLPEIAATLVKCTQLSELSPLLRDRRRAFTKRMKLDPINGWRAEQFRSFVLVLFDATHDACFGQGVAERLTGIPRDTL
ncbi:hypothetical protein BDW74DRAFT_172351 [Aspergillus multicolor]|uniref:uncharacterized protein n=1 Tax=Aspergillus multicolor TaxID=41759 RepID=UPI003CCDE6E6